MSSSPCDSIREALPWFVGGDLEVARSEVVRAHLVECFACRAEAATLQQGIARLQRAAVARASGVDDMFFGDMHRTIMAQVGVSEVGGSGAGGLGRALAPAGVAMKMWMPLAALLLVGLGFWAGRGRTESIFDRPPLGVPLGVATSTVPVSHGEPPTAVPWAGDGVPLRLLGEDFPLDREGSDDGNGEGDGDRDGADVGRGTGMMGRRTLRQLVNDRVVLPPRH
jgi:hypothetical protein